MANNFPLTGDPTPKIVKADKDVLKVKMFFPGPAVVRLALPGGNVMEFKPGVQEVPAHLADHVWLKLNKATRVDSAAPVEPDRDAEAAAKAKADADKKTKADAEAKAKQYGSVLGAMTKAELVVHGKTTHDLDLDSDAKKQELIDAILEASAKKEQGNAA